MNLLSIFRRKPTPSPSVAFADLSAEAQAAAVQGIRAAIRRLDNEISVESDNAQQASKQATCYDNKAVDARQRLYEATNAIQVLRQQRDALAQSIA